MDITSYISEKLAELNKLYPPNEKEDARIYKEFLVKAKKWSESMKGFDEFLVEDDE
jgi:hypothetical protein